MVLALAALYVHYGSLPWIQGMFYGIGAAVIAIIVRSAIKLVRTTLAARGESLDTGTKKDCVIHRDGS
jgi:chromate transport protein ChrA